MAEFHVLCRYVSGDFRFRNGYCRSNPRKMVKMWAEKEFRNLHRLQQAGIPCPQPMLLRQHVLVMGFIGKDGVAAPRLKVSSHIAGCCVVAAQSQASALQALTTIVLKVR
jgi:serine/threonine-protein kinase RIO1